MLCLRSYPRETACADWEAARRKSEATVERRISNWVREGLEGEGRETVFVEGEK
jgi:hypothetical protein